MEVEKILIAGNDEETLQLYWEEPNKENVTIWIKEYEDEKNLRIKNFQQIVKTKQFID